MKLKSFLSGFLTALLLFAAMAVFAEPIQRTLSVTYNDIRVFLEGKRLPYTDIDGNYLPAPFIYKGSVFVSAKSIAAALNKPVKWDNSAKSLYIGEKTALNRKDFDKIKLGMAPSEVEAMVGSWTKPFGSGLLYYAYELDDGSMILMLFNGSSAKKNTPALSKMTLLKPDGSSELILEQ